MAVKPENILLATPAGASWDIKVTDFGFSKIFNEGRDTLAHSIMLPRGGGGGSDGKVQGLLDRCHTHMIGTPFYRAPEMVYCCAVAAGRRTSPFRAACY